MLAGCTADGTTLSTTSRSESKVFKSTVLHSKYSHLFVDVLEELCFGKYQPAGACVETVLDLVAGCRGGRGGLVLW